tara:strand:- start:450 stop:1064 length:615 start_codon:yes stop_codon:yes gene_type:complete
MTVCSVCLDEIENNHVIKTLTCGHKFHYRCFLRLAYRSPNFFIDCPLCRKPNEDVTKPFHDPERNIRILCSGKVGKVRCICRTKKGTVCKRKGKLLNYGMCYQHSPNILKKEFYPLMEKYLYFIMCQRYNMRSRLYSIDLGKKLIMKYADSKTQIEDILIYWLKYITINKETNIKDYNNVYDYYGLEKPDELWINHCSKNYILI